MLSRFRHHLALIACTLATCTVGCELVLEELPAARNDAPIEAGTDAFDGPEAPVPDAAGEVEVDSPEEVGGEGPETGPDACTVPCDCDGDDHLAISGCEGDDCDDDDVNVYTGQESYFESESSHRQFDYDCNNKFDPDPAWNVLANCAGLALLECDETHQGYATKIPACGQPGAWAKCARNGLVCEAQVLVDAKRLPCK